MQRSDAMRGVGRALRDLGRTGRRHAAEAARVRTAVAELPEQERTLVERHYFGGERFDKVAAELGLSKSWASRLHTRAVARLVERFRSEDT